MKKETTKAEKTLRFIKSKGKGGAARGEIERFICEMNGHDYDEMNVVSRHVSTSFGYVRREANKRRWSGYWSDNLQRLFAKFCDQDKSTRKWRVVKKIEAPFYGPRYPA